MELGMIICLAAVACVGLIEWTKNLVEKFFKVPGFVWSLAVFVGAMLCGFIAVYGAGITAKTPLMAGFRSIFRAFWQFPSSSAPSTTASIRLISLFIFQHARGFFSNGFYDRPEGSVNVVQPASGPATVRVKHAGFTFRPAAQGLAGKDLKIALGARLMYFNRYGVGIGIAHDMEPYLFADRRIDDFVGIFKNTTVGVYGGPRSAGIMLGVYF